MTVVGITGANGFLGWHVRCRLHLAGFEAPVLATRETFADEAALQSFVDSADVIFHLAGVNRANSDAKVIAGNHELATKLGTALRVNGTPKPVVYANSIKALDGGPYGDAKADAARTLAQAQAETGGGFADVLLPHLFGEFGTPFYNSAVTTFGHQLAVGEQPNIQVDATLELLHCQDVAATMLDLIAETTATTETTATAETTVTAETTAVSSQHRLTGHKMLVSEALALLTDQHRRYVEEVTIPAFADRFEQQMFNLLRSQLFANGTTSFPITRHSDPRGFFAELIRNDGLGQSSISASVPGITRGDHYHVDKIERFLVVCGQARIQIRRLFTDDVHVVDVSGLEPVAIDMPPLCTHNITNTGEGEMLTFFWAADQFDPANPDTFPEPVVLASDDQASVEVPA